MYMLFGSIIPGNSFFELSSLPSLIKHYQQHKSRTSEPLSLLSFLKLHYANPGHQKSDPVNHGSLPLQHQGNSSPVDEIVNLITTENTATFCLSSDNISISFPDSLPENLFSSGIFHPPSVLS
jgi:hypothetical protein